MKKYTHEEIQEHLSTIQDWQLKDGKLYRKFVFKDFTEAFDFMTKVARVAEEMNHHPEWSNVYKTVEVYLTTHDVGGVSVLDFELATKMNEITTTIASK